MKQTTTRRVRLDQLNPAPYNPRAISPASRDALAASLDRFGLVQPIVWNERTGNVVGGHQRLAILAERGLEETEVVVVDLDEEDEKALNVALNSPGLAGDFTAELQPLLVEIREALPDLYDELDFERLVVEPPTLPNFTVSEPMLKSDVLVEIRTSREGLAKILPTLQEWNGRDDVAIDVSG